METRSSQSQSMTTPKGTVLPYQMLKGKQYLQVAHRLVWFREEKPDWRIETEYVQLNDQFALAKATIRDSQGSVIATAHKREDARHFADYCEKCETGALGRALAMVGYGTQFGELLDDDQERIADAPVFPATRAVNSPKAMPGAGNDDGIIKWGQLTNRSVHSLSVEDMSTYLKKIDESLDAKGTSFESLPVEAKTVYQQIKAELSRRLK